MKYSARPFGELNPYPWSAVNGQDRLSLGRQSQLHSHCLITVMRQGHRGVRRQVTPPSQGRSVDARQHQTLQDLRWRRRLACQTAQQHPHSTGQGKMGRSKDDGTHPWCQPRIIST